MSKTGFTTKKSTAKAKPPIRKVTIPPYTLRPGTSCASIKRDVALKRVLRSNVFIASN